MTYRTPLMAACALAALAAAMPAWAQSQPPEGEDATLIEELTVTAERRAESVQDVPLAITAIDDATRERVGISTITDMAQFTPGLYYNNATDRPAIRGIARASNTFTLDSPVASYVDGVYTSSIQDASRRPMFVERNEILRGPQGALSGRGSVAGSINTILKRPEDEFGGAVGLVYGNYDRFIFETTVTGPILPWLRGRFNASIARQGDGYFENLADNRTAGTNLLNRSTYDLLLEADFGENVDGFFKFGWSDYKEKRRTGSSTAPYISGSSDICVPGLGTGNTPSAAYGYFGPGLGCGEVRLSVGGIPAGNPLGSPTVVPFDNQSDVLGGVRTNPLRTGHLRFYNTDFPARQELTEPYHNYTAHLTWHAPWADVKWIGGLQEYAYEHNEDADGTPVRSYLIGSATYNPANPANPTIATRRIFPGTINRYEEQREWYSNELTFTSTADGPFQWIFGLYESVEEYDQTPQTIFAPGFATALAQPNTYLACAFGPTFCPTPTSTVPPPNAVGSRLTYGQLIGETVSRAAFGQADWELNDQLKFSIGLRYNNDAKEAVEQARFLQVTSTVAGDSVVDNTFQFFRGYTVIAPASVATAVVPEGYTLLAANDFPVAAPGFRTLPDGSIVADGTGLLFAPGVQGFPTMLANGARARTLRDDWNALTGSAGVDWTPNEDTLIYARYARGYRPGGFNAGFLNAIPEVKPEYVNSYEVGTKFTYSGSLQLNAAAFFYNYKDIQQNLQIFDRCTTPGDLSTCTGVNTFVNLPSAETKGLELEAIWYPNENFQLLFTYGYLDARIKNGKTDTGYQNPDDPAALLPSAQRLLPVTCPLATPGVSTASCLALPGLPAGRGQVRDNLTGQGTFTQDLSGNPLPVAPKHKIAVNGSYTLPGFVQGGDLTLSMSWIWRSESYSDLFATEFAKAPAYDQVNARMIYESEDQKYQVIGYVQNLFNEDVSEFVSLTRRAGTSPLPTAPSAANGFTNSTGPQVYYRTFDLNPPRTFGVEVQRRF